MTRALGAAVLGLLLLALPVAAGGPPQSTGTIALDPSSTLVFGGVARFDITTSKLRGNESPAIWVQCYQDEDRVYGLLGAPDHDFVLGGPGTDWSRGAADCTAQLWARRLNTLDLRPLTDLLAFHVEA